MYDIDTLLLIKSTKRIILWTLIIFLILVFLLMMKKEIVYHNSIMFNDNDKATIVVDKKYLNVIKKEKKIFLLGSSYDYSIEKITYEKGMYFVDIVLTIPINIDLQEYEIKIGKETILKYILRTMKGEI